jgi:hypothetical protein
VKLSLSKDITVTDVDHGAVIFDGRRGEYYQLNPSAALALRALLDGEPPGEAATRLSNAAPVSPEQALADVLALVDQLRQAQLVVVAP